ncbi:MAG: serine/threonine-protein kinase [Clostridiales bacterium]|nr:serine/threonine-protein kinase [Clostridiales bacterium]
MNKLLDYIEISSLNETTSIVQRGSNIYVEKKVPIELTYIYKTLISNRNKHISYIVDIFEYEDVTVVVEEFIEGETLSDILDIQGTLDEVRTKNIIGQLCDGLLFLHNHNIIHRDINPNNIMIRKDGTVIIIDFDISRSVRKGATSDTAVLGTVGYAAPEQFGFSQSDIRTDIYAVGVLANVMLTGKMPNEKLYGGKLGKSISKATAIDARMRYKNISSFKHAFTNEPDENTKKLIKALRYIPGFRTWKVWKMIVAIIMYLTYIPLMVLFMTWATNVRDALIIALSEIMMFVIPFVLLTNLCGVSRHLAHRPIAAFVVAVIVSAIVFVVGTCIFSSFL